MTACVSGAVISAIFAIHIWNWQIMGVTQGWKWQRALFLSPIVGTDKLWLSPIVGTDSVHHVCHPLLKLTNYGCHRYLERQPTCGGGGKNPTWAELNSHPSLWLLCLVTSSRMILSKFRCMTYSLLRYFNSIFLNNVTFVDPVFHLRNPYFT